MPQFAPALLISCSHRLTATLRLLLPALLVVFALAGDVLAQGNGNGNGNGNQSCFLFWCWDDGGDDDEEEEPPYESGRTRVIYIVGSAFFPSITHADLGDKLMFVNVSRWSQTVEAEDGSWESNSLGYGASYTLLIESGTDLDFRGRFRSGYTNYSFSGDAVMSALDAPVSRSSYPRITTSLAEVLNLSAVRSVVQTMRGLEYTVDLSGNVVTSPPIN